MNTNKIKLNESRLKQIISESVKRVLNETISTDYRESLKQLLTKAFTNLNDNEKQFLYDLLNNEPWETIYIALGVLESNRINESRKKREPRKGTIELNGKHIDAVEDGLDKNGNPMYKVNDPSIKGRRCKDGSIRVQHYNFKPNRVNEGEKTFNKVLNEGGYYSGEYDRTGLPLNDSEYVESIEYVIDSIVNGNYNQALELIKNMDTSDRRELIKYAREVGYIDDLMNIMTEL